ncbi:MAG: DUF4252 domain-containing protein [Nonlabens sp.]|jgi:hypothetical protein|uniref:DUF4252 domain-containing protein n=1 Tax=Nonlabens sp. TaxID=1888209 RepID=UPI0035A6D48F
MNKIIFKIVLFTMAAVVALASCDTDPTLQSYIVDSVDKEGFISTSIPKTILGIDDSQLSEEAKKAYRSINKVSLLMYPKTDGNTAAFEKETMQLSDILDNEDYNLLMTHNGQGMKAKFLYQGDKDAIDEIIVFGMAAGTGMGVARILGKDMNLSGMMKMMKELENLDINPTGIKSMLGGIGIDVGDAGEINKEAVKSILESNGIDTSEMELNKE